MIKKLTRADQSVQLAQHVNEIIPKGGLERICDEKELLEIVPEKTSQKKVKKITAVVQDLYNKKEISHDDQLLIEAIILPETRPVIDILDDDYTPPKKGLWSKLLKNRNTRKYLKNAIPSVGRIELPNEFRIPYGGTGFVVGKNLLMTNRHVAELFASGLGIRGLRFIPGQVAGIDFKEELNSTNDDSIYLDVREIVMIHPYWDMAILKTTFLPDGVMPLNISTTHPDDLLNKEIAVIGYPAFDSRNDGKVQNDLFRGVYDIKRLQPGTITGRRIIPSFENWVNSMKHNASTLGGNSGSAIINLKTGNVVGLHFAGKYKESNYAVPMYELAKDSFVIDAGVNFQGTLPDANHTWTPRWRVVDPIDEIQQAGVSQAPSTAPTSTDNLLLPKLTADGKLSLTIPVELTIGIGGLQGIAGQAQAVGGQDAGIEKPNTTPDPDYSNRVGYRPDFLPFGEPVLIPWLSDEQYKQTARNSWATSQRHVLPYEHFSIVMNRQRRMAFFTAVNIDGNTYRSVTRSDFNDDWNLDPRIDANAQMENEYYKNEGGVENPLDRGHLVRRLDPCWGAFPNEVLRAHHDTFHWTNSSPQHRNFNRLSGIWNKIEVFILENADASDMKISVLSGPVFRDDDPVYMAPTGVQAQLPKDYWKIVCFVKDNKLAASAYLLSQNVQVDNLVEGFVFGEFKNTQISITSLQTMTDLDFQGLADHDTFPPGAENIGGIEQISLRRLEDAVFLP